jgi:sugar O-acyltransferase (sialic acid O-acetyltransferase NeuD family)
MILIGYSGHAFVVYSILNSMGRVVTGYCDNKEKEFNPFNLSYLGSEKSETALNFLNKNDFFISVGDNNIRKNIFDYLASKQRLPINAIHPSAIISKDSNLLSNGVMVSAGVIINPLSKIGNGVICNTGSIIEHECEIGQFSHIGPGAILCGNTHIGEKTFVGAGAVVRQGITIGNNVIIGAGSVVVKNIADNSTVMGCPAK